MGRDRDYILRHIIPIRRSALRISLDVVEP